MLPRGSSSVSPDICRDIDQILLIFRFGKAGTLARILQCNSRSSTFSVFPGSSPGAGNNIHRLTFPGVVSPQSDRATSCWSCKQHPLGREKQKISALLALVWYSCQNAKQQCCTRTLEISTLWEAHTPTEQWRLTPTRQLN